MMRGILSLARCLVWAHCCRVSAAQDSYEERPHVSHESIEKHVKPLETTTEPPYITLPTEPPEDTIEALHTTGGVYEKTSVQDRPDLDPFDPDLSKVTLMSTADGDNELKTTFKWFGKSTRCTANVTEPTATVTSAATGAATSTTDAGNGTSTSRKQLKVTHAPYSGPHTGPPEDHYVDDA